MTRHALALRALGFLTSLQVLIALLVIRPLRTPTRTGGRPDAGGDDPRRILVVRLDETIGDTVMFSPFLRELRLMEPNATITLVVNAARRDMYDGCPHVDELLVTDFRCAATGGVFRRPWRERSFARARMRGGFDIALVPRADYDHHAAFLAYASRAPMRVGYSVDASDRKRTVCRGMDRLFTHVLHARPHRHEIDRGLDVLEPLGSRPSDGHTEVWIGAEARDAAKAVVTAEGLDSFAVIAPTGGHSDLKRWPIERYGEVAAALAARGLRVVAIGAPADGALLEQLDPGVRSEIVDLTGRLSVMGSAALIDEASVFVGADSGMSHVAAALGVPTVAVFGPTCVDTFAPRGERAVAVSLHLPCGPTGTESRIDRCASCIFDEPLCMRGVTAVDVLTRIEPR